MAMNPWPRRARAHAAPDGDVPAALHHLGVCPWDRTRCRPSERTSTTDGCAITSALVNRAKPST